MPQPIDEPGGQEKVVNIVSGLFEQISEPADLKKLAQSDLKTVASEMRQFLVESVSRTGGHFASNMGTVELAVGLHYVFDSPRDKFVWDTGHQAYPHKLLTGRRARFDTLRQYGGISGFLDRHESEHDMFGAGHATTSISAALGMAVGRDLNGDDYNVVAIIGDGAMTGGMAFEALNNAGMLDTRLIVILNDNTMSISPNVGAWSKYLDKVRADKRYLRAKDEAQSVLKNLPLGDTALQVGKRIKKSVKDMVLPTTIWEELGFVGLGPIDGHDIDQIIETLRMAKDIPHPVFIHALTTKGKGYDEGEVDPVKWHAWPSVKKPAPKTYMEIFADTLSRIAADNRRVVAITAAMREGTGLPAFARQFPDRFFDVGIAEEHAITFAAGLATQGIRPVAAIYSTFLQRGFDQIIHDVCIQNLPVIFAMDRAGLVGDDGRTHQGMFDVAYMRLIPNMVAMAPKDENELQHMLYTAVQHESSPTALRYPRGAGFGVEMDAELRVLPIGKGEVLRNGNGPDAPLGGDVAIIGYGTEVYAALEAADTLTKRGLKVTVVNARFVKPLDADLLLDVGRSHPRVVTCEEACLPAGFGSAVCELYQDSHLTDVPVLRVGVPDMFIEHGTQALMRDKLRINAKGIVSQIEERFPELAAVATPQREAVS